MARPRTLVERLAATRAIQARHSFLNERISEARLRALTPADPRLALAAYERALAGMAERAEMLIRRHVIGNTGSIGRLEMGLAELEVDLLALATKVDAAAGAAFKRATQHARVEAQSILDVRLPALQGRMMAQATFVQQQEALLQAAARRQVAAVREVLLKGGSDADVLHKAWVMRNGAAAIARNEVFKLARAEFGHWASQTGSIGGYVVTHPDERRRETHAANHGKFFLWSAPPPELLEVNCRCKMVPGEQAVE